MKQKITTKIAWKTIYRYWPGLFYILDDQLQIMAVSTELLKCLDIPEERLINKYIAEAYSFCAENESRDDLKWRLSMEYIHQTKNSHVMSPVRLSLQTPSGKKDTTFCRPVQTPVFDDEGKLLYIIHQLERIAKNELDPGLDKITSQLICDGIYIMDFPSRRVNWNDQLYNMLGYKVGEIEFNLAQMLRAIHHEDRMRVLDVIREKHEANKYIELEYRLQKKDGKYIEVRSKGIVTRSSNGKPLKFIAAISDISHYKNQEYLKARLELITATVPAMICYIDQDLKYQFLNSSYKTIYSKGLKSMIGKPVRDFIDNEAYAKFLPSALRALNGERVEIEYANSKKQYYKSWYIPDIDENGAVRGFIGLTMDMTREKKKEIDLNNATQEKQRLLDQLSLAHEQINREKNMLKSFFMEAPSLIAIHEGPDYTLRYLNRKAAEIYGNKLKIGEPLMNTPNKLAYDKVIHIFDRVYHQQKEYRAKEFSVKIQKERHADGVDEYEERYFDFVIQPTRGIQEDLAGVIIYANDVTDQVLAKRTIQENAKRDRMLLEAMPVIAYIYNANGKLEYLNYKWYEFTGTKPEAPFRDSLVEGLHPDDITRSKKIWAQCLKNGKIYNENLRIKGTKDGYKWHHTRIVPVIGEGGEISRWIGTSTDIDDQIRENQKKDELISVASHELKTPLTSVMAYLQLIKQMSSTNSSVTNYLNKAYKNAMRLHDLIVELLDVSRIQSGKMVINIKSFSLEDMVKEVVETHQDATTTHKIKMRGSANVEIKGDRERLERVLHNLLSNAVKYSPGKNEVLVSLSKTNDQVILEVTDYGMGIPKSDIKHLFSQFFRSEKITKSISGLGIGLFISQEIAKRHGGNILIESTEGVGSTFSLILPLNASE